MISSSTDPDRSVGFVSVNRFQHPGPPTYPRITEAEAITQSREIRVLIPPHTNAGHGLREALSEFGTVSGCGRIAGGSFSSIDYYVVTKLADSLRPFGYGDAFKCHGELMLVTGTITLGRKADGVQVIHCHGGFVEADGTAHGGHLDLDRSIAGATGLVLRFCLFSEVEFVISPDRETNFDLLTPTKKI
jgi:hypothetical protein